MSDYLDLSWEETVISKIERSIDSSFGLVEDLDNLLSEQVLAGLVKNGWGVTSVTNLMELRFEYEDQVRQVSPDLVTRKIFIIRFPFTQVSYDIFKEGNHLQISIRDFFPYLSYNVMRSLPAVWRPVIFRNQSERLHKQRPLSDIETANFIIRDCLGLDFSPNPTYVDILSLMADMALHQLEIPAKLTSVMQTQLSESTFSPLFEYIDAPGKIVQFLRTVWEKYIQFKLNVSPGVSDEVADEVAKSVTYLDKNREFQTKMTALIAEDILPPAEIKEGVQLPDWMHIGKRLNK
jgi:hypothetical protein